MRPLSVFSILLLLCSVGSFTHVPMNSLGMVENVLQQQAPRSTNATYRFYTSWGFSGTGEGQFNSPVGIALDASHSVYVSDGPFQGNGPLVTYSRIQKFSNLGKFLTEWNIPAWGTRMPGPVTRIAADTNDSVYVAANNYAANGTGVPTGCRIAKFSSTGSIIDYQWALAQNQQCVDIAADDEGNIYLLTAPQVLCCTYPISPLTYEVSEFSAAGQLRTQWRISNIAYRFAPSLGDLAVASGRVYVGIMDEIWDYDTNGALIGHRGPFPKLDTSDSYGIGGIAADSNGDVFITVYNQVWIISPHGELTAIGSEGTGDGQFSEPLGIADSSGSLYVVDNGNNRVQMFSPQSVTTTTSSLPTTVTTESPNPQEPVRALIYYVRQSSENSGILTPTAAILDSLNGFGYFVAGSELLKVNLADFNQVDELPLNPNLYFHLALIDPVRGFVYLAGQGKPPPSDQWYAEIVRVRLSDFTYAGTLNLPDYSEIDCGVIDSGSGYAYFGGIAPSNGSQLDEITKISLENFTTIGNLALAPQNGLLSAAVIDDASGFGYFATLGLYDGKTPSMVFKIRLSDFTVVSSLSLGVEDGHVATIIIDDVNGMMYLGTGDPNNLIRLSLGNLGRAGEYEDQQGTACSRSLEFSSITLGASFLYGECPNEIIKIRIPDFTFGGSLEFSGDHAVSVMSTGTPIPNVTLRGPMVLDQFHNYLYATAACCSTPSGIILKVPVTAIPTGLPEFYVRPPLNLKVDYPQFVSEAQSFSINVTLQLDHHDEGATVLLVGSNISFENPYGYPLRAVCDSLGTCTFQSNGKPGDEYLVFPASAPMRPMIMSFNVTATVTTDVGYGLSQTENTFQIIHIFIGNLGDYAFPVVFATGIGFASIVIGMQLFSRKSRWRRVRAPNDIQNGLFCNHCRIWTEGPFCHSCGRKLI